MDEAFRLRSSSIVPPDRSPHNRSSAPDHRRGRPVLWCALHLADTSHHSRGTLETAASLCQQVSDQISLLPPDTVVFEAGSSLRHFRGIHALRRHLAQCLHPLEQPWTLAASPAAAASVLLARSGHDTLVADTAALRAALGTLPLDHLPMPARTLKRLRHSGLKQLRDLWRLPSAALRQRLGPRPYEHLQRCLGQRPWPLPRWQPPLHFHRYRETEWPLTDTQQVLYISEELLADLQQFLHRHDVIVEQMVLQLHDATATAQNMALRMRSPSRRMTDWYPLLTIKLEQTPLDEPVYGITLEARHFQPFRPDTHGFMACRHPEQQQQADSHSWQRTLDLLEAQLGQQALYRPTAREDWSPEAGSEETETHSAPAPVTSHAFKQVSPRPTWLLDTPQRLPTHRGQPCMAGPLRMLSGPERIQTHWWDSVPIQRDYYVAETGQGQRIWLFRELTGARHWYLHGLFG